MKLQFLNKDPDVKLDLNRIQSILTVYLVNKCLITIPAIVALIHHPSLAKHTLYANLHYILLDNYERWDAPRFHQIAVGGYYLKNTAFFPFYPLLVKGFMHVFGLSFNTAGAILSNLAFLLALYFAMALLQMDYTKKESMRVVWLIGVFPTSYYFSAQYTESLFFLLAILVLFLLRTQRFALAAACGFFAAATRNIGVFLTIPFLFESFEIKTMRDFFRVQTYNWKHVKSALFVCIIPVSMVLYMAYLYETFHDPLSFTHAERFWGRAYHNPCDTVYTGCKEYLKDILHPSLTWKPFGYETVNTLCVVFDVGIIVLSFRNMRLSYWVILLYSVLIPLSDPIFKGRDYFMSITRYSLVIFPLYIGLYELAKNRRWIYSTILIGSALMLMILMYVWTINKGFIA